MKHVLMVESSNQDEMPPFRKVMLDGAQQLLGVESLKGVMQEFPLRSGSGSSNGGMALSEDEARAFPWVLEKLYGTRGGRGLSVRIGRSTFTQILKHYGASSGLLRQEFRLLPASRRLYTGLNYLAGIFQQNFHQQTEVQDHETHWLWRAEHCLNCCEERFTKDPGCYLMAGILQEFLTWASGGRVYQVVETECASSSGNSYCVFRIDKKPLD